MLKVVLLSIFAFLLSENLSAQTVQAVKADDLLRRFENGKDTIFVVNFWATWCAPCVKELPYFETLNKEFSSKGVKVLLVSLDFRKDYSTRLPNFIQQKGIESEVLFLDEKDANEWVPKFSEKWSGVIPATWVSQQSSKIQDFRPSAFEAGELEAWLKGLGLM